MIGGIGWLLEEVHVVVLHIKSKGRPSFVSVLVSNYMSWMRALGICTEVSTNSILGHGS